MQAVEREFTIDLNIRGALISPDGKLLAIADTKRVRLWTFPELKELEPLFGEVIELREMAFSPDGTKLACTYGSAAKMEPSRVIVWDVATRKRLHAFNGHKGPGTGVAFSPDGKRLFTGSLDMTARIWDVER